MKKIYYKYGTMYSGKSLNLISTYKTYMFNNQRPLVLKHAKDTRDENIIKSRMSKETVECITFTDEDNLLDVVYNAIKELVFSPVVIMIDEIQFCTIAHIEQINVLSLQFPIICYGLKTNYMAELFPASAKLIAYADSLEEMVTTCSFCGKRARFNLLTRDGKAVREGNAYNIDGEYGNEKYYAVCRQHYFEPNI